MEHKLDIPDIAIGEKIQAVFESRNIRLSDFADQLGTVRQNVYRIFKKKDLDTGLLTKVSEVLSHNFFHYYNTDQSDGRQADHAAAGLQQKLDLAQQEIDYLKRIIHLMDEKARLLRIMEDARKPSTENEHNSGHKENRISDKSVPFFQTEKSRKQEDQQ